MKDKIADILTVILMIGIYIGLPILLYVLIFKVYKNRRKGKGKARNTRWFSVPLLIVNAAPAFMITLHEQGGVRMNEELWYCVMSICFVLTMTATVIECGVRGIGIGLVRFIAGTALGLIAGGSVILFYWKCTFYKKLLVPYQNRSLLRTTCCTYSKWAKFLLPYCNSPYIFKNPITLYNNTIKFIFYH